MRLDEIELRMSYASTTAAATGDKAGFNGTICALSCLPESAAAKLAPRRNFLPSLLFLLLLLLLLGLHAPTMSV